MPGSADTGLHPSILTSVPSELGAQEKVGPAPEGDLTSPLGRAPPGQALHPWGAWWHLWL